MSLQNTSAAAKRTAPVSLLLSISLVSLGLQILLPIYSYRFGWQGFIYSAHEEPSSREEFLKRRLRFERFFEPVPRSRWQFTCLSATVCQDELVALIGRQFRPSGRSPRIEDADRNVQVYRCDLRSGRISVSSAPDNLRYLLSDGKKIWWLPEHKTPLSPFLWEGKPTSIAFYPKDPSLCQLVTFENGAWYPTEQFALLPDCFDGDGQSAIDVCFSDGRWMLVCSVGRVLCYLKHLEFTSREKAIEYRKRFPTYIKQMSMDELLEMGWKTEKDRRTWHADGYWHSDSHLFALSANDTEHGNRDFVRIDLKSHESVAIPSPLEWDTGINNNWAWRRYASDLSTERSIKLVDSTDGRIYLMCYNRPDGRIAVLQFDDRRLRMITQSALCEVGLVVVDGLVLFLLLVGIPSGILVLLAWAIERRCSQPSYQFAHDTLPYASIVRRASARAIDSMVLGGGVMASIGLDPTMLAWWHYFTDGVKQVIWRNFPGSGMPPSSDVINGLVALKDHFIRCFPMPVLLWIFAIAMLLLALQITWQGWAGRTIGKSLMGIRVTGTSLRPCGIYRSLLRELLLAIDGTMFLCWVPGVTMILGTVNHQRLGDRWADTIVVRVPPVKANAVSDSPATVLPSVNREP